MTFTDLNPNLKMSATQTHVFFLNGPFSQWHPADFVVEGEGELVQGRFNCAEQYMMAAKAALFGDEEVRLKIMAVDQQRDWREAPKAHKALGRTVRNFEPAIWDARARDIVYRGNLAKFGQNENLAKFLRDTGSKVLVEGAHYDPVWGVGLAWNDPRIIDPANWQGTNWLGEALMRVRETLAAG